MNNILILVNASLADYEHRLKAINDTWASGSYFNYCENVHIWFCLPMTDEEIEQTPHKDLGILNSEERTCKVPFKNDLLYSWEKMRSSINSLSFETTWADWIFITNTTTYVNIPLLNDFVQTLVAYDYNIYTSRVISPMYMSGPYQWCFYPEGSGILFLRDAYMPIFNSPIIKKNFIKEDMFSEPDYFRRYKRMIFDTAFGSLVDEYLIHANRYDCLKLYEITDYYLNYQAHDHTKFYKDWNGISFKNIPQEEWYMHLTMTLRDENSYKEDKNFYYIDKIVWEQYKDNDYETDMRLIHEYIDSKKRPLVTQSLDQPNCCIDDEQRIPFDDYHKWLEENSNIPNLEISEDGAIVPSDGPQKHNGVRYVGPCHGHHLTYAQYFNIPFWNHCCWYKNPFTPLCGYGPAPAAKCCEAEQLVYPGGTPWHEHEGPEGCDCGCHNRNSEKSSGSSSSSDSGYIPPMPPDYNPDDEDPNHGRCGCFHWNEIKNN